MAREALKGWIKQECISMLKLVLPIVSSQPLHGERPSASSDTTLLTPPTLPFSVLHDRIHANNFSNLAGVHGSDKWRGPGDRCCRSVFFFFFFFCTSVK